VTRAPRPAARPSSRPCAAGSRPRGCPRGRCPRPGPGSKQGLALFRHTGTSCVHSTTPLLRIHSMSAPWRATHSVVCDGRHGPKPRPCAHTLPTLTRALRGYRPRVGPARGARLVQQELHDRQPVVGALDVPGPRADDLIARTGPPISTLRGGRVGALKDASASRALAAPSAPWPRI
jgi:hypothetical protein